MADFPYRDHDGDALARALAETVRSDPAFVAACLVVNAAHGFTMQVEYAQRADGSTRYRTWSDVQGQIAVQERNLELDLQVELARLRAAHTKGTRLPDIAGGGRRVLVILANADNGTWVETPTPARGQRRGDSPVDRILGVVFP